jgi:hypothetical protein
MSEPPLPASLKKHLKLANIEGVAIQDKLHERRLVQIVSYLELVSMKLRHKQIHRRIFRENIRDSLLLDEHCDLLDRIIAKTT